MYILVLWTVVAATTGGYTRDWRPIGEFKSERACYAAGLQLKPESKEFRCLYKGMI